MLRFRTRASDSGDLLSVQTIDSSNNDESISFLSAIRILSSSDESGREFRRSLTELIRSFDPKVDGVFWECRPVSASSADSTPFEFVLLSAEPNRFMKFGNELPFMEHLRSAGCRGQLACSFLNLGGDAILIAPVSLPGNVDDRRSDPMKIDIKQMKSQKNRAYPHLSAFCHLASDEQIDSFWQVVGESVLQRIQNDQNKDEFFWLSTAGLGVDWLHVRIDSRPKYYRHRPFKTSPLDSSVDPAVKETRYG